MNGRREKSEHAQNSGNAGPGHNCAPLMIFPTRWRLAMFLQPSLLERGSGCFFALLVSRCLFGAKIGFDLSSAFVLRPVCRGALPKDIFQIEPGSPFDEKPDNFVVTA